MDKARIYDIMWCGVEKHRGVAMGWITRNNRHLIKHRVPNDGGIGPHAISFHDIPLAPSIAPVKVMALGDGESP